MGKRILDWWKRDKRYVTLVKAALIAMLPFWCVLIQCAADGFRLEEVYLPSSEWNDELFYYKQVEGILNGGFPYGFFGFNESHAARLSFAAWSPVLVLPWVLWGMLFGWNLMSPIYCNLFVLTLAAGAFVLLTRPTWKQTGILGLLMCLFKPFARYVLSGMPEILCIGLLILFLGFAICYLDRERGWKLAVLFALAGVLTWMRPYMLLFLLLPVFFWIRRDGWRGLCGGAAVTCVVLGVYAAIKGELGAEYFHPLFFTDWVTTFFERGFFGGCRYFLWKLCYMGTQCVGYTVEGFRSGLAAGAYFGGFFVMLAVLLWQCAVDGIRLRRMRKAAQEDSEQWRETGKREILQLHMALCFVGMLFAILLMYKLTEGSKHLITFMAVGIFVVSRMRTAAYKKTVLIAVAFVYLYSWKATNPYDYQVPYANAERVEQMAYWQEKFDGELRLETERVPSFDNTVIWALNDEVEGVATASRWQILYMLPEGFGINCCEGAYVREHLAELRSRYLAVVCGGEIDAQCGEAGYAEIGRDGEMVVYRRY